MQKHYFIGIKIPSTFGNQVKEFQEKYELDTAFKVIPHTEDLHVTLFYLGSVAEQHLPTLKSKLSVIAAVNPQFSIYVDGLSYFGSSFSPRVVYLSIGKSLHLSALQKEVEITIAKQLEMPISDRFTPHVTIAKKRKTMVKLSIQEENFEPIEVPVHSFSLFTIHPEKTPKYEAIETFQHQQS